MGCVLSKGGFQHAHWCFTPMKSHIYPLDLYFGTILNDLCGWWMKMVWRLEHLHATPLHFFDHVSCRRFFSQIKVFFFVQSRSKIRRFISISEEVSDWMLHLDVALPSGHTERLCISKSSKVGQLKLLALQTLGRHQSDQGGGLKLITAEGISLDSKISLEDTKLQDGDHLLAVALPRKCLAATGMHLHCGTMEGMELLHGVMNGLVVIVQRCKRSWKVSKKWWLLGVRLLLFWQMDQLLHGVMQEREVIVQESKISWKWFKAFRQQIVHLLPAWQMDQLLPGHLCSWWW